MQRQAVNSFEQRLDVDMTVLLLFRCRLLDGPLEKLVNALSTEVPEFAVLWIHQTILQIRKQN